MKKRVYLSQPSDSKANKSVFLPYSAGCLAAYAFKFKEIRNLFDFCGFIYVKETIEKSMELIENPSFVGFSCYMWNVEYNLALAKAVKEKYPEAIISFGGPQIPDDTEYLEKYDFIDVLTYKEGEKAFYELLSALGQGKSFEGIKNTSFRIGKEIIRNEKEKPCDLTGFPSPYTSGFFDYIVNDPELRGTQFDTVIETNRGCPYGCLYCCWARSGGTFRLFPMEKVKAELLWMAENKISFCICADSNFGMLERDEEIADYIIELKSKYGYPEKMETLADKNKSDVVFRINRKFDKAGLNRGISVAVQSMSPEVLKIIGRKNMSFEELSNQLKQYRESGMYTYTDLILGLPGETYISFCDGLFKVIEAGQHYAINVNRCEFLPNSPMYSKEIREKFKIKTIKSNFYQSHSYVADDGIIGSRSDLVVETSTLSSAEWRDAVRLSTMVLSFHCMGLLRLIAIYLRKAKKIPYKTFYMGIYKESEENDSIIFRLINEVCKSIDLFLKGEGSLNYSNPKFGNIYWSFEEALFLNCADNLEEFYDSVSSLVSGYNDGDEKLDELIEYQKEMVTKISQPEKSLLFKYDWPEYFSDIFDDSYTEPVKRNTTVHFDKSRYDNFIDYAREIVLFGKRSDRMINKDFTVEYQ